MGGSSALWVLWAVRGQLPRKKLLHGSGLKSSSHYSNVYNTMTIHFNVSFAIANSMNIAVTFKSKITLMITFVVKGKLDVITTSCWKSNFVGCYAANPKRNYNDTTGKWAAIATTLWCYCWYILFKKVQLMKPLLNWRSISKTEIGLYLVSAHKHHS